TPIRTWIDFYLNQARRPEVLLENSTLGTLSTDGRLVFAVDDLAVSPPQAVLEAWRGPMADNLTPALKKALSTNELHAYSLASGKIIWIANGDTKAALAETCFLGPPLPLDGKLYVLAEKQQELRLITLDPAKGTVLAVQTLGTTRSPL